MTTATIGRRGQITIPKAVRQALALDEGDRVAFVRKGSDVVLQPIRQTLRDLRGTIAVTGRQDFEAVRAAVRVDRAEGIAGVSAGPAEPVPQDAT